MSPLVLQLDPSFARGEWSVRQLIWTESFAVLLGGLLAAPPVAAWLGIAPLPVLVHLAAHGTVYTACVLWVGHERLSQPAWWPARLLDHLARVSVASSFGGAARLPASPMWSLVLLFGMIWGHAVPNDPLVVALILVVPLAVRTAWNSPLDADAVVACLGVSAVSVFLYLLTSRTAVRVRSDRIRADAQRMLLRAARAEAANLRAAMSLHDGLSGALYVARRRVREAPPEEAARIALHCAARVRDVVAEILRSGLGRDESGGDVIADALGFAREVGEVRMLGVPPANLRADLASIVTELAANAARHGTGESRLDVRVEPRRTVVLARSSAREGAAGGSGRGLRNVRLRAEGHGGCMRVAREPERFEVEVSLPHESRRNADLASIGVGAAVYALACGSLVYVSRGWEGLFIAFIGLVYLASIPRMLLDARRHLLMATADRTAAETSPALARLSGTLLEHASALETVASRDDASGIPAPLDRLSADVGDALDLLEATVP